MKIQLADPKATFEKHYSTPENRRILFSGKFGIGKSYFLKDYFEVDKADDINTFWLSPVKYSVSVNEDIFEYIKFDLALKLIARPEFAQSLNVKIGEQQYIYGFLSNQMSFVLNTLYVAIAAMSEGELPEGSKEALALKYATKVKGIAQDLIGKFDKYKQYKAKIEAASKTVTDIFSDFLTENVLSKGSIFEDDLVTQTVRSALAICKARTGKDNILIIDDFDRLDPEHVFRILNILSVHNDTFDEANKFGFDKIIIVCDYDNIKKIYAHKYGAETSFDGYISKFYSIEAFYFNNYDAIQFFCEKELRDIITDKDAQDVVGLILSRFVKYKLVTMRDIIKINISNDIPHYDIQLPNAWTMPKEYTNYSHLYSDPFVDAANANFFVSTEDLPLVQISRMLVKICGGTAEMKSKIDKLIKKDESSYSKEYAQKILNLFLTTSNVVHNMSQQVNIVFLLEKNKHQDGYIYLKRPISKIFNNSLTIPIQWNSIDRYKGQASYYKGVNQALKASPIVFDLEKFDNLCSTLFEELKLVVEFMERNENKINLGISTD